MPDSEGLQRRALRRNRALASGLLVIMAAVFVGTAAAPGGFWRSLLHAASEAAVVGGLADWFAVTALFRRPLGLPIPHTAIVPRNKDRIGAGLGNFLERHFLTDELLLGKLRALDIARRLAQWLLSPGPADWLADRVVRILPHVIAALDDQEIRAFASRALSEQLRETDLAPLIGKLTGLLTAGGYHAAVLDRGIEMGLDFLDRNAERLEQAVSDPERGRWWLRRAIDRQVARAILRGINDLLQDLRDPQSNARNRFLLAIDDLARDLVEAPERRLAVHELKTRLLEHPEVEAWLASVWDRMRELTLADLERPDSRTRQAVATAVQSLGRALLADPAMRQRLNASLEAAALELLPWRVELARFISEVVHRWDERVLVARMELALGADLQYVRFTGTVVGGSIGCLLFLLSLAMG